MAENSGPLIPPSSRANPHDSVPSAPFSLARLEAQIAAADEIFSALKSGDLSVDEAVAAWAVTGDLAFPGVPSDG